MNQSPGSISGRLLYYDRNPIVASIGYDANGIAPHALTVRATYTVPVGARAIILSSMTHTMRTTVATVAGEYGAKITYTPNAGAAIPMTVAVHFNLSIDTPVEAHGYHDLIMLPGDVVQILTLDLSTNGVAEYHAHAMIVQFNP